MISILHKGEIGNGFELTAEGKLTIKAGDNVKVTEMVSMLNYLIYQILKTV